MFIFLLVTLFYIEKKTDFFKEMVFKEKNTVEDINVVRCNVQTNMNSKTFVSLTFLIPFNNKDEEDNIKRSIPQMRNIIIGEIYSTMSNDIRQKNFQNIKEKLITIVNSTVNVEVTEVYLDTFNLLDNPSRT